MGGGSKTIISPEGVRAQIEAHIEEILHCPNVSASETQFKDYIDHREIIDDTFARSDNADMQSSNDKRGESKLWYYMHRANKEYHNTITGNITAYEINKAIQHQQNGRSFGTDHIAPEILKTCKKWFALYLNEYPHTTSKPNFRKCG